MKNVLILLFSLPALLFSQENNQIDLLYTNDTSHQLSWHLYKPYYKADIIYNSMSELINEYEEQLMHSINSSISYEWDLYNFHPEYKIEKKTTEQYQRIKNSDRNTDFMNLVFKLNFNDGETDYAIIKFHLHLKEFEKPLPGIHILQKYKQRWVVSRNYRDETQLYLMFFKIELLDLLLTNDLSDPKVNDLRNNISIDGSVSLESLYDEINKWLQDSNSQAKIDYFMNFNQY